MISQLIEARSARLGTDASLRHDSIALLAADGYLLPREKCASVASWRSWQGERVNADFPGMAGAMFAGVGSKRIDAVQGGHITDVHVIDTTTFPTSLGPPPRCLPV